MRVFSDYPVFGISLDLGNIIATESPVVWSVGYVRDPAIQYMSSMGDSQFRSPYFVTQYENVQAVVSIHFPSCVNRDH